MTVQLQCGRDPSRIAWQRLDANAVKAICGRRERYAPEIATNIQQLPEIIGGVIRTADALTKSLTQISKSSHVMNGVPARHLVVGIRGQVH